MDDKFSERTRTRWLWSILRKTVKQFGRVRCLLTSSPTTSPPGPNAAFGDPTLVLVLTSLWSPVMSSYTLLTKMQTGGIVNMKGGSSPMMSYAAAQENCSTCCRGGGSAPIIIFEDEPVPTAVSNPHPIRNYLNFLMVHLYSGC